MHLKLFLLLGIALSYNIRALDTLLPIPSIKLSLDHLQNSPTINTMCHNTHSIRIRPRDIEALYAACLTEPMFSCVCVEGVCCQVVLPGEQGEGSSRDYEVFVLLLYTD